MSNQPNTNKEELLKSIKTALRGTSILFYWSILWLPVLIVSLALTGVFAGIGGTWGEEAGGYFIGSVLIGILVIGVFIGVYAPNLIRRGLKGIGRYYNNQALIDGATEQFILWLLMLILPAVISLIVLIPLGLKMSDISGALYNLTGIKDFDVAKERWKVAAYLAIILVGGLISLFALYSTRKGFKEMLNQVSQQ